MKEQSFYVVTYDIPDGRRRSKVAKILEDYGDRVQYSVFELILDGPDRLTSLRRRLSRVVDDSEDSVRIYSLCSRCRAKTQVLGLGMPSEDPTVYVV